MLKKIQEILVALGIVLIAIVLFPVILFLLSAIIVFVIICIICKKNVERYKFDQQTLDVLIPVMEEFPIEHQGEVDQFVEKFSASVATLSHEQRGLVINIIGYLNNITRFSEQELFAMVRSHIDSHDEVDASISRLNEEDCVTEFLTIDFHDTVLNNIRDYKGNMALLMPYLHVLKTCGKSSLGQEWYTLLSHEDWLSTWITMGPEGNDLKLLEHYALIKAAKHFKVMYDITNRLKEAL